MAISNASAIWKGNLVDGSGTMKLEKGAYEGAFTRASRFENGPGTNPEEMIGAAHAGCFSMFLSAVLSKSGFPPVEIRTSAKVPIGRWPHHHADRARDGRRTCRVHRGRVPRTPRRPRPVAPWGRRCRPCP